MAAKRPLLFLSYSSKDKVRADALERALQDIHLPVWRDVHSVPGGSRFEDEIDKAIRASRGVVVLLTKNSSGSEWVYYEYAFALGARVPVMAVVANGEKPMRAPFRRYQVIRLRDPEATAEAIRDGLRHQARVARDLRAAQPVLLARFQEENGVVCRASADDGEPAYWMDLWIENASPGTTQVEFEILDNSFKDRKWRTARGRGVRAFLTDQMSSWGDVEIWAKGTKNKSDLWSLRSNLFEALRRYYRGSQITVTADVRRALKQIRRL